MSKTMEVGAQKESQVTKNTREIKQQRKTLGAGQTILSVFFAAGVSHDSPRAKTRTFEVPADQNTTKIPRELQREKKRHKKTPRERKKDTRRSPEREKNENGSGRGKKREILGGPDGGRSGEGRSDGGRSDGGRSDGGSPGGRQGFKPPFEPPPSSSFNRSLFDPPPSSPLPSKGVFKPPFVNPPLSTRV